MVAVVSFQVVLMRPVTLPPGRNGVERGV